MMTEIKRLIRELSCYTVPNVDLAERVVCVLDARVLSNNIGMEPMLVYRFGLRAFIF